MAFFDESYSFDDVLTDAVNLAHEDGMSYEAIAKVLCQKFVVVKCVAKADETGLNEKLLQFVNNVVEGE